MIVCFSNVQITTQLRQAACTIGKSALELEKEYNLMEKLLSGAQFCANAALSVASQVAAGARQQGQSQK